MLSPTLTEMHVPLLRAEREREGARERLAAAAAPEGASGLRTVAAVRRVLVRMTRPTRRTPAELATPTAR